MHKEYTFTPKFKLIVDHLKAVRTLDEYVNGVALKKDMQAFSNDLQQDISYSVLHPAGWEGLQAYDGSLYASPKSKWRVLEDDEIAVAIYPAWPVQDPEKDEPYVELYVPANWEKRVQFITKLKIPPGFEHVNQYPDGELAEGTSIFKYVRYTSYIGAEGLFDSIRFLAAFRDATQALVDMEKDIDEILDGPT